MYLISVLTNRPKIQLKIGNNIGDDFETLFGIMNGDVLRAILFILYLSKCQRLPIKTKMKGFLTTPKYADDITYAGRSKANIDELEIKVPKKAKRMWSNSKQQQNWEAYHPQTTSTTSANTIYGNPPQTQEWQTTLVWTILANLQTQGGR